MERFFIIDGSSVLYRSYFAFLRNPIVNSKGEDVGMVFGFINTINAIIKQEKPELLCVVFDSREKTFRHEEFESYKANRQKMPEQIAAQFPLVLEALEGFCIPQLAVAGYEADDIIAALAKRFSSKDRMIYIVSSDKDLMQLVDDFTFVYNIQKGVANKEVYDSSKVIQKFGVPAGKILDYLSLVGDASDNIPGVPGVGPKTAAALLSEVENLEAALSDPSSVKQEKFRNIIAAHSETIRTARRLLRLAQDAPVIKEEEDFRLKQPDRVKLAALFSRLEFKRLAEEFGAAAPEPSMKPVQAVFDVMRPEGNKQTNAEFMAQAASASGTLYCHQKDDGSFIFSDGKGLFCECEQEAAVTLLGRIDAPVCAYSLKSLHRALLKHNKSMSSAGFDAGLASYLIDPVFYGTSARQYVLKYLGADISSDDPAQADRAAVAALKPLWELLRKKVEEYGCGKLLYECEIPLCETLARMELDGIMIDISELERFGAELEQKIHFLVEKIIKGCGCEFNINSPQQLGAVLFEKLRLQDQFGVKKLKKTKTGYSTDTASLQVFMPHPTIEDILIYRHYAKLKSTYVDAFKELAKTDGLIHTTFNQNLTQTGRLSSSAPNMQNIPVKTGVGRQLRKVFKSRFDNGVIISADYSQIELRIVAHLSGDEGLTKAFKDSRDVHTETAARIFNVPQSVVTSSMRSVAKTINFGIMYGMGPRKLSRDIKISFGEAQRFIQHYFSSFPGVKAFIDSTIDRARETGFVETIMKRRRAVPDISSANQAVRAAAENIAVNTPVQGSAADLIKLAMVRIGRFISEHGFKSKMVLQIHDELLFDAVPEEADVLCAEVKRIMEGVLELDVPLTVEINKGKTWYEAGK